MEGRSAKPNRIPVILLHGGIGFTWECDVPLYFKRQKHSEMLFGDGAYQRAKLGALLAVAT